MTSIGVYNNDEQSVYWFTEEEATGFMQLFNELQYKSIDYPAGYYPIPLTRQFDIRVKKEDGDRIIVYGDISGGAIMSFSPFVFLDGQDDKEYALAQYVYSLDGIQAIPELRDIGKTVLDDIAQQMKDTSQPSSTETD